jgi:hypothetical protein
VARRRAEGSLRAGVASLCEGSLMTGRVCSTRPLRVRRGHEFSRLQQQLLALAYEQLLPIIRPKQRATAPPPRRAEPVPAVSI